MTSDCATIAAMSAGIAQPKKPAAPMATSIFAWRFEYFSMVALAIRFRSSNCVSVLNAFVSSALFVRVAHRLASLEEYPKKSEVIPLKNEYMDRLNRIGFTSGVGVGIVDFVEKTYFPAIEKRLARSTVKGYKDAWRCHFRHRVDWHASA